jgi:threonine aldolase
MRQVGVIASAGVVALESGVERLREDHDNARALAHGLAEVPGITIDLDSVQTNIVNFDIALLALPPDRFVAGLDDRGVKMAGNGGSVIRAVTSSEVTRADIDRALAAVSGLVRDVSPAVA